MNKVLSIVPYPFLPYFSGGQKLIAQFNAYLGEACELHVAGTANNNAALAKHYTFYPFLRNSRVRFLDVTAFFRLQKLIRSKKIDTIIIEHPYFGWLGWLLRKATGARLIVHTHNIEHERFRSVGKPWWKILKWYETAVLRSADTVFCISDEDMEWMINKMQVQAKKCVLVPYGITNETAPADKAICKKQVCAQHQIDPSKKILFFNGLLDYKPNTDALTTILEKINPLLLQTDFPYHILIAGKRLPESFNGLKQWNNVNVSYAGFVDDIDLYTKAADVLLNPVTSGGGVKTKMIEALGMNTAVVATTTGAMGVKKELCGDKLVVVTDDNWPLFIAAVIAASKQEHATPDEFYTMYSWKNITQRVAAL
ncbi:glycosyltransferase [Lacibacter luteus]|uniref:Glycosyltransferase n=1 Tax=Lacibacter luteus TaxID=2508719 RepID=A0A4Q1CNB9_9BACT|nr:glycosyltransferase family 4 protein [Lacibacter luteus]RXK62225.1 glycosyltransferase [Lacibacter luteus]